MKGNICTHIFITLFIEEGRELIILATAEFNASVWKIT